MRSAIDAAVSGAADAVIARVSENPHRTTEIVGTNGSGRSAVLELVGVRLAEAGSLPVVIAPPARQYDTAALALLDTAVGLSGANFATDLLSSWTRPATWSERTTQLRGWLKEAADSQGLVLLVDDASRWAMPESAETSRRLETAADLLLREIDCTRVVAMRNPSSSVTSIDVPPLTSDDAFGNASDWGALAESAATVGTAIPEVALRTPADIGFVVALTALASIDVVRAWWDPRRSSEHVADRLVAEVRDKPKLRRLWAAWIVGSVARRPVAPDFLGGDIERIGELDEIAIFEKCLLAPGGRRLAREARAAAWRAPDDDFASRVRADAAARLYAYYLDCWEAAARDSDAVLFLHAAEALHFAGRVGAIADAETLPAPFSDQLNALGMAAIERFDFEAAASAFDLALEIDPDDPLASHYLGYSLDNDALEPLRVEGAYERALELDGSYASWHARLICFLVIQARVADALRRWESTRAELLPEDGDSPVELYARLHLPVAAHLLRRAELAMSYVVLDDVPSWAHSQLIGYREQRHRLEVLENAQHVGSFVPAHRASPQWWKDEPELLSDRHPDGRPLEAWLAGSVEALDPDGVHLSVALVVKSREPRTGTTTLTWDQVRALAVDVRRAEALAIGDFLEVGYYGHGSGSELPSDPVVRVLQRYEWREGAETALDPERYIRRAFR